MKILHESIQYVNGKVLDEECCTVFLHRDLIEALHDRLSLRFNEAIRGDPSQIFVSDELHPPLLLIPATVYPMHIIEIIALLLYENTIAILLQDKVRVSHIINIRNIIV